MISWIKISTGIFDDEKMRLIEVMKNGHTFLVVWFKLLVQAGKCNANGNVTLTGNQPLTDEMLAVLFSMPLESIRLALEVFSDMKMIEVDDQVIRILNWGKHQNVHALENIKEQTRIRVANYRTRQQMKLIEDGNVSVTLPNATVTQQNKNKHKNKNQEYIPPKSPKGGKGQPDYSPEFLAFYQKYPRKEKKAEAFKEWKSIAPQNGTYEAIMSALEKFKSSEGWKKEEGKFIPHPSTWLYQRRWEDQIEATPVKMKGEINYDEYKPGM